MNVREYYNSLYNEAVKAIKAGDYHTDSFIDSASDNRFGITLLVRPDEQTANEIQKFLHKLRIIEPDQYYYPESDLHVTVMSIISCYEGFDLSQISIEEYIEIIKTSVRGLNYFDIEFKGLTASTSCIMVQGFFKEGTLNQIRDNLRRSFGASDLQQSIDKRYSIQTAHCTIARLKNRLKSPDEYLRLIEDYRTYCFGTLTVDSLELVFNDWYQRKKFVKKLHRFKI